MKKEAAIRHILEICETYKGYIHWQITARVVLASLYHDARIIKKFRDEISEEISQGTLYNHDHLLRR